MHEMQTIVTDDRDVGQSVCHAGSFGATFRGGACSVCGVIRCSLR